MKLPAGFTSVCVGHGSVSQLVAFKTPEDDLYSDWGKKSVCAPVHWNKMQQDSLTLSEKKLKKPHPAVEIPFTPKQLVSPKDTGLVLLPGYNCVCDLVVTGRQMLNSFSEKIFVHADGSL